MWRYAAWDGSQDPFPVHADDLMDQLSEHLMGPGDVGSALRTLTQRGVQRRQGGRLPGIQDLVQQLRQQRQQVLDRSDLGGVLAGLREELQEIARLEREGIRGRVSDARERCRDLESDTTDAPLEANLLSHLEGLAERNQAFLDSLPDDPASAIAELQQYEFMDDGARERFDQLMKSLQQHALGAHLDRMTRGMQRLTPEEREAVTEMVQDLNRMLEERARGGQPDYERFLQQHGGLLGDEPPATLDELVEQTQREMAQLQSLLRSLTQEQRDQLQDALDAALQDEGLRHELARLATNLEYLQPMGALRQHYPFQGNEPAGLDEAMGLMGLLQRMEGLEQQLRRVQHGGGPADIDRNELAALLGNEAARDLEYLQQIVRSLEDAGYIRRSGSQLDLTPRGIKRVGVSALREIFTNMKRDRSGQHATPRGGMGIERLEATKTYEFGDPFDLDLKQTLFNTLRHAPAEVPLRMRPDDFEVFQSQQLSHASTVLLLDLSLSMAMRGSFSAAKKVALALDNLIRTQFPRDTLSIVGFSTYAREVKAEKLASLTWDEFDPYTNIQHGLAVAQRLLTRISGGTKQILLISDGEPTAHIEGGHLFLQYPPNPRTIRATLREVKRCTSKGITINTFLLDRSASLVEFVDHMSQINRGRVFYTSPERLGQYILVDYFASRRRLLT